MHCEQTDVQIVSRRKLITLICSLPSGQFMKQEAFEKCWADSPLQAAARRTAIHQVSLLSHAATVACRLRIDVHDNNDNNDNA